MKSVLKNTLLVFGLFSLFAFPFASFGFISYSEPKSDVLGASFPNLTPPRRDMVVVDQIELEVNLSSDPIQKFYNVLPEEYLSSQYQIVVVVPEVATSNGIKANLEKNSLSADLSVEISEPEQSITTFKVVFVVLK